MSNWDVRNKALAGVFKELQRNKRELILNELKDEIMWCEEEERKERLRARRELQ
jgi:hypothetical protein